MSDKKKTPKNREAKQKNKSQDIALIDELADAMVAPSAGVLELQQ